MSWFSLSPASPRWQMVSQKWCHLMGIIILNHIYCRPYINRGYYTVARRYEFYFRVAKQYFTNERSQWVKYCFCHEKIKFISSSRLVMFFLLYRQKDIDKIIEGNDRNYVIDKLTCEIMENKPLGSRMHFLWILRVVYFPVKHSCLYNKYGFVCCAALVYFHILFMCIYYMATIVRSLWLAAERARFPCNERALLLLVSKPYTICGWYWTSML